MFNSLKEVLVPARPFDTSGGFFTEKQRRAEWEPKRKDLENLAMFKSGKTKLRTLELGEVGESENIVFGQREVLTFCSTAVVHFFSMLLISVGDPAKDECCVSYLRWLAP